MTRKLACAIITFFILTTSCKKNAYEPLPAGRQPRSFIEVFDAFWNGMNRNYVFWDVDTTNWKNIYQKYRPLFQQLNLTNQPDLLKSVEYFKEMTKRLIDGHYRITFNNPALAGTVINPALERKLEDPAYHAPISYFSLVEKYLDSGFLKGIDQTNNQGNGPLFALSGTINNRILYFGCNEFSLSRSYNSNSSNSIKPILDYFFVMLDKNLGSISAVIIDVRNNRGGDMSDLNFLVGRLITAPVRAGYFHTKRGPNPLDFTPWVHVTIPALNTVNPAARVFVLQDNFSASLAEAVAMSIGAMPNGSVAGERSYGATGPITGQSVFNTGGFDVGNFLRVETSSVAFKYIDNKVYEGVGFPPGIAVPYNADSIAAGIDPVLKHVIALVN